jgi:hypothetical protein
MRTKDFLAVFTRYFALMVGGVFTDPILARTPLSFLREGFANC